VAQAIEWSTYGPPWSMSGLMAKRSARHQIQTPDLGWSCGMPAENHRDGNTIEKFFIANSCWEILGTKADYL
jgi:hypothetical protein